MLYFTSQQKIYPKRKITYKNQNLEQNCVLQESCKTVRCWQRSILLVKGGHCVGDWFMRYIDFQERLTEKYFYEME